MTIEYEQRNYLRCVVTLARAEPSLPAETVIYQAGVPGRVGDREILAALVSGDPLLASPPSSTERDERERAIAILAVCMPHPWADAPQDEHYAWADEVIAAVNITHPRAPVDDALLMEVAEAVACEWIRRARLMDGWNELTWALIEQRQTAFEPTVRTLIARCLDARKAGGK